MKRNFMEAYVQHIFSQLSEFSFVIALFAPLLGGEIAILGLAFLAGQGTFSLWGIILGSFVGMLLLDVGWFLLLRFPPFEKLRKSWGDTSVRYKKMEARIELLAHQNDVFILFISKLLIGTRVLILAYLSLRKISLLRFLTYDSIATFVWALALGYLGFASGRGYLSAMENSGTLLMQIMFIGGFVALCYVSILLFRQWILRV